MLFIFFIFCAESSEAQDKASDSTKRTTEHKEIKYDLEKILIAQNSLPFGFQIGDSISKVNTLLQEKCKCYRRENIILKDDMSVYGCILNSTIQTIIFCIFKDDLLYSIRYTPLIESINNKNAANQFSQKICNYFKENMGAKNISFSATSTYSEHILILPYALLKIITMNLESKSRDTPEGHKWTITIDYSPIPEDLTSLTNSKSIGEIENTLNELKK